MDATEQAVVAEHAEDLVRIVGIGGSAGGLQAMQEFFANVPSDTGMAFVVILHLSPEYESNLAGVLGQATVMPVIQVTEAVRVERDHVYVIAPNKDLRMADGHIELTEPEQPRNQRAPIDLFFRTLGESHGANAAAIVFSGTGADGSIGLPRVKENGGLTLVQDPTEAEYDAMPRNAIDTGFVDLVLPVAAMPARLIEYWRNAEMLFLPSMETLPPAPADAEVLRAIFALMRARTGHDFSQYKLPTIMRRIARRMQVQSVVNLSAYLSVLRAQPQEVHALLRDLLISVTNFFRDQAAWLAFEQIIPRLFANKKSNDTVRVWVAGCATGEEAYTLAILLYEYAMTLADRPSILIFATDIDEDAIAHARQGLYLDTIASDISPERLQRFFAAEHGRYRVSREIRDMVLFAVHNVLHDPPFSRLDLVTCRNLLIYFNRSMQDRVLQLFHFVLQSHGYMLLGSSESADGVPGLFVPVDKTQRLFGRRVVPTLALPILPSLPIAAISRPRIMAAPRASEASGPSFTELDLYVLANTGPPTIIVNEEYEIVHLARGAGQFLAMNDGEPSHNLLRVIDRHLRPELRTALFTATQNRDGIKTRPIPVEVDNERRFIEITVQPIEEPEWARGFIAVLFRDTQPAGDLDTADTLDAEPVVRQLEDELQRTKEQLRATIEQYETVVEEYKAGNEELQAINEELRAATEELETSKEELQSVNEELLTVNQELKHKVEEVILSNNDLQNFMASTQIGTVFVDRELRIKRYTPSVEAIFNLIPGDANRPLVHVTHNLEYDALPQDAKQVLATLIPLERELRSDAGRWYLVRLQPYRTTTDIINGVVLTFIDITGRRQAETALRESEERYRSLFTSIDEGFCTVEVLYDEDGKPCDHRILEANPAFQKQSGIAHPRGKIATILAPDLEQYWNDLYAQVVETGESVRVENRSDTLNRWFDVLVSPVGDAAAHQVAIVFTDITERKRAEEHLRESEQRLRMLIENLPGGAAFIVDTELRYLLAEGEALRTAGMKPEGLVGKTIFEALPAELAAEYETTYRRGLAGEPFEHEHKAHGRSYISRGKPLRSANGDVYAVLVISYDITERERMEGALRTNEERLQLVINSVQDYAIFTMGLDGRIMIWNQGAEHTFGYNETEAIGQNIALLSTPEDQAAGVPEQELQTALLTGRATDERWHVRKDGLRFFASGVTATMLDEEGKPHGFVKVARDLTERRQAEQMLEKHVVERTLELTKTNLALQTEIEQRRVAEQARQDMLRQLVTAQEEERRRIARELHDQMGQQLAALRLGLDVLENTSTARTVQRDTVTRLQRLVAEIDEDVDRLALELRPSALDNLGLSDALQQHVDEWSMLTNIGAEFQSGGNLPARFTPEIETVLYRVAQEALNNVLKHANARNVSVILERRDSQVQVIVEDDGQGFDLEAIQQSPDARRKLGLLGMQERVALVGGTATIESELGIGTTIYFRIPLE